jgi:hypothetical protein
MITAHFNSTAPSTHSTSLEISEVRALGRLIAAAVINKMFCRLLLEDPAEAVRQGFNGEKFGLSPNTQEMISSIQASTLPEFAAALDRVRVHRPLPMESLTIKHLQDFYFVPADSMVPTQ